MNIALIIPQLTDGGAERVVSELSYELSKNHKIFILLYENKITYPFKGKVILLNKSKFSVLNLINKIRHHKKVINKENIECSISFSPSSNIINILTPSVARTIVTVHIHLSEYYQKKSLFFRIFNKLIIKIFYPFANKIITVSNESNHDLVTEFGIKKSKIETIYNFYNYKNIRKRASIEVCKSHGEIFKNNKVIINIGRLTYAKGQHNLIRAFSILKENSSNDRLVLFILGDGSLFNSLQLLIDKLNLSNSVYLLGFQSNPYKYINLADIFVLSSKYEGMPMVLLEAIGLGTPVISTDCFSGPKEILACDETNTREIQEEFTMCPYGILTPVTYPESILRTEKITKNERALSSAIQYLLSNSKIRKKLSKNALDRSKEFSASRLIYKWESVIM